MKHPSFHAVLFALRNKFEHNPATVYKPIYVGEIATMIEAQGWDVTSMDVDVDDVSLTEIINCFRKRPAVAFIWAEVHQARLARQIALTAKKVSPETKLFVYGRASVFIPQYFERHPFDAVHVDGDREQSVADYIRYIEGVLPTPSGISMPDAVTGQFVRTPGQRLTPEAWPLPALSPRTIEKYRAFSHHAHGDDYRFRLSVTVSKGCELECAYCGAPKEEGTSDRRRPVQSILEWAVRENISGKDAILHLFASNLFADPAWVREFCEGYARSGQRFHWRGVTTVTSLTDPNIVGLAGRNGCKEVAVGIETLFLDRQRTAKSTLAELDAAVNNTRRAGIKLKGLVMLGYPGQREEEVVFLEQLAQDWQIELRYTGYTPLHQLRNMSATQLDQMDIESYDRRTYYDPQKTRLSGVFFYDRISRNGGYFKPLKKSVSTSLPEQSAIALAVA